MSEERREPTTHWFFVLTMMWAVGSLIFTVAMYFAIEVPLTRIAVALEKAK